MNSDGPASFNARLDAYFLDYFCRCLCSDFSSIESNGRIVLGLVLVDTKVFRPVMWSFIRGCFSNAKLMQLELLVKFSWKNVTSSLGLSKCGIS